MAEDKISVIVPIYNLSLWLERCVESILSQTHRNLEVILVDDGSGDESLSIAREFALRERCGKASRELVKAYDARACAESYTRIYQNICSGKAV